MKKFHIDFTFDGYNDTNKIVSVLNQYFKDGFKSVHIIPKIDHDALEIFKMNERFQLIGRIERCGVNSAVFSVDYVSGNGEKYFIVYTCNTIYVEDNIHLVISFPNKESIHKYDCPMGIIPFLGIIPNDTKQYKYIYGDNLIGVTPKIAYEVFIDFLKNCSPFVF